MMDIPFVRFSFPILILYLFYWAVSIEPYIPETADEETKATVSLKENKSSTALWVAATDYSGELAISDEILKRVVESYRRIRNTLRFLMANTADFDPAKDSVPVAEMLELDRYALAAAGAMAEASRGDYARYEFHLFVQRLQTYCSEDLGGFYLDVLKDRLYTTPAASRARRSAQNALYHIAQSLTCLLAPILSFTAQEVWETLNGNAESVRGYSRSIASSPKRRRLLVRFKICALT
jgi:isoleucyl-tRNA synthetase